MRIKCYRFHLSVEQSLFMTQPESVFKVSIAEIESHKHEYFIAALKKTVELLKQESEKNDSEYSASLIDEYECNYLIRFGKTKEQSIVQKDFISHQNIQTWNSYINVFIDANPNYQLVGIEHNNEISITRFKACFIKKLCTVLAEHHIAFELRPITYSGDFWEFADTYRGYVKKLKVTLDAENMSSLNADAAELLKVLRADSKADHTDLELRANANGGLNISHESSAINSIERIGSTGLGAVSMEAKVGDKSYTFSTEQIERCVAITKDSASLDDALSDGVKDKIRSEVGSVISEIERVGGGIKPHD